MCVPRKPHPQGNDYHSIADADNDGTKPIMWCVKLVKGKDRPKKANARTIFDQEEEVLAEGSAGQLHQRVYVVEAIGNHRDICAGHGKRFMCILALAITTT